MILDLTTEVSLWMLALRKARKTSRRAVAEACGIPQSTLAKYEPGCPIPLCKMADLFRVYRADPDYVSATMAGLSLKYHRPPDVTLH